MENHNRKWKLNFNPDLLLVKSTKIMINLCYLKYAKIKMFQRTWVKVFNVTLLSFLF